MRGALRLRYGKKFFERFSGLLMEKSFFFGKNFGWVKHYPAEKNFVWIIVQKDNYLEPVDKGLKVLQRRPVLKNTT